MANREKYLQAQNAAQIVRVYCADRADGWVEGFIAGVGKEFFALEVIDSGTRLNGFSCMRYEDVSNIEIPAPHHEFIQKALEIKKIVRSEVPDFNLWSLQGLLKTGEAAFPLTTLHIQFNDGEYSDVCYIGNIVSVTDTNVTINCIDPDAEREEDNDTYPLNLIYRVDYGDDYAEALFLVSSEDT